MNDRNKNIMLGVLIVGVISMTIAFAVFTSRLRINGQANVSATKWNIHFDDWTNVTQSTVDGHTNTAEYDDSKIEQTLQPNVTKIDKVNVLLKQPGDYVRYTFKIKNDGTIDGSLDYFTYNLDCENGKNCEFLRYTIECKDEGNNDALQLGYILEKDKYVSCDMEIKYKDVNNQASQRTSNSNKVSASINQVYEQEAVSAQISAQWIWNQSDGSSGPQPTPETFTLTETETDTVTGTLTETDTETGTSTDTGALSHGMFYFSNGIISGFNPDYFTERGIEQPTNLVIPSEIDGETVTEIGNYAFDNCYLESLTLPNTITTIGSHAFDYNNLTSVVIPNSVTIIDDYAFSSNNSLASVTLGNNVQEVGSYAFDNCYFETLTLPASITSIGDYAFTSERLSRTATTNAVTMLGDVDDISFGTYPFGYSHIYASPSLYNGIANEDMFDFNNGVISGFKSVTIFDVTYDTKEEADVAANMPNLVIPSQIHGEPVTEIADYAFDSTAFTSVTIPSSVNRIGSHAFYYCEYLTTVTINGASVIDDYAFEDAPIETLVLGNGVTTIGEYAFANNPHITSLTIPNSVTTIGDEAFSYCSDLESVTFGTGLTTIGQSAFHDTILSTITIPSNVTSIGSSAFVTSSPLDTIHSLGSRVFNWCDIISVDPSDLVTSDTGTCECRNGTLGNTVIVNQ